MLGFEQASHSEQDNITRILAALFQVPSCAVILLGAEDAVTMSAVGFDKGSSVARPASICSFLLTPEDPKKASTLLIESTLSDDRVAQSPLVLDEPKFRFYAGAPMVCWDGLRIGSLCCFDTVPRTVQSWQMQLLVNFAQIATRSLEAKDLALYETEQQNEELFALEEVDFSAGFLRRLRLMEFRTECVLLVWAVPDSMHWPLLFGCRAWTALSGLSITPEASLPATASVVEATTGAHRSDSLWDHLRVSDGFEPLVQVRRSSPLGPHRTFALDAVLADDLPCKAAEQRISCRFSPAEVPLDVAAAAININPGQFSGRSDVQDIGLPQNGHLYFVTITTSSSSGPLIKDLDEQERSTTASTDCKENNLRSASKSSSKTWNSSSEI